MSTPYKKPDISEEIQRDLKTIIDHFELEDRAVRDRQIRLWKKLDYYWNGFQRVWWSEVAHDWRVWDNQYNQDPNNISDMAYYDKPVNVFKAYLESIIAALSATVPPIKCLPDDPDNPADDLTAKGGTKIAELVYKHNDAPLLWIHALFIYCTQGMLASYNYTDEDESYGTVGVKQYKDEEQELEYKICPICKQRLVDEDLTNRERYEFDPGEDDVASHELILEEGKAFCPQCLSQIDPEIQKEKMIITRMVGINQEPKSRQCVEVYGGINVRVPNYARNQKDTPYLAYCYETHFTNVIKMFPWLCDKRQNIESSSSGYEMYERWGRLSAQYFGEYPLHTPTVRNWWLRPSSYWVLGDEDCVKRLQKKFPDGCRVIYINEEFAYVCNENLDDHWTLGYNPLSNYVHYDPLGVLLTSIQEITNDLIALTLQTIEHGISQTFADTDVLNFKQYQQTEATPGAIYPVKPKSGKSIADGFYSLSTATLSKEVEPFGEKIQELAQFTSGAVPSIYGGGQSEGSKTAAQYSMSRSQALQRLQTPYKILLFWWKNTFGKVIPAFIKDMVDDEQWSKDVNGSIIKVVVKKAQLDGKIGAIELDVNDQLPIGWAARKDTVMNLLSNANPAISQALTSPENAHLLAEAIGLDDFEVPGEDDRQKQFEEIQVLLQSGPIPDGQGGEVTSVQPELYVDNHSVEMDICRYWAVSEAGRQAKVDNPKGYKNVLLHMQTHFQMKMQIQQMMAPHPMDQEPQKPNQQNAPSAKPQQMPEQGATNVPGAAIH